MRPFLRTTSRLAFVIALFTIASCGTSDVNFGGGTVVSNPPTVSTTSLSPEFDERISESATLGDNASSEITSELTASDAAFLTDTEASYLDGPAGLWAETFLNGPVARFRSLRNHFQTMGERIAAAISSESGFELSETPQILRLGSRVFFDATRSWTVGIALKDDNHVKAVFRDSDTGEIGAYYLFVTNDDGIPVRGVFAYVNPDTLSANNDDLVRFLAISFDFTDSATNELTSTIDGYDTISGRYAVQHMQYQCDESSGDCLGEFLRIDSAPPLREFSTRSVRLSWNESTRAICIAPVTYAGDVATLGTTQEFTGPETPDADNITSDTCTIAEPFWATRAFSPDDFPNRFEDDDSGGFAAQLFGDGTSESLWDDNIATTTIDDWLVGRF